MSPEQRAMAELLRIQELRRQPGADQAKLGPEDHRLFERGWTQDNPIFNVPASLAGIPVYTAAKALGLTHARSPASLKEMLKAYEGVGQGIGDLYREGGASIGGALKLALIRAIRNPL